MYQLGTKDQEKDLSPCQGDKEEVAATAAATAKSILVNSLTLGIQISSGTGATKAQTAKTIDAILRTNEILTMNLQQKTQNSTKRSS